MTITIDGTTGIASVDGSAGSPSVRGSDSNSGIVYAADTVSISTGGTERLEVDSSGNVDIPDNGKIRLGGSGDLSLYHDASHSIIEESGTGGLKIVTDHSFQLRNGDKDTGEYLINANVDGAAELYYNGVKTFETTSAGSTCTGTFNVNATANTHVPQIINDTSNTATYTHRLRFDTNGTEVGRIRSSNSATVYDTSASDRTLKKNFESWNEDVLSLFKNINPQKFNFIQEEDGANKTKGFIAQELTNSFPEAYSKGEGEDDKYWFNPSGMVVYLMKALQESITKIETLETKVAALEAG